MRYSPANRFFFVHIPKCAGSSVSRSLGADAIFPQEAVDADMARVDHHAVPGAPLHRIAHGELGNIHLAHIPLYYLRRHFPSTWALFETAESFVVMRDPRERFLSAVMQRLREFHGLSSSDLTPAVVRREAAAIVEWLSGRERFCDLEYIHFTRQTDFIQEDGAQRVSRIFTVERIGQMGDWLAERFAVERPQEVRANPTVRPAGWFQPVAPLVMSAYKRTVPWALRERLTPLWRQSGLLKSVDSYASMRLDPGTERFVEERYGADAALHREALANAAQMQAA